MSKMLAVRVPDSLHTYIKHKALIEGKSVQQLAIDILSQYQKQDADYMTALDEMANQALQELAGGA